MNYFDVEISKIKNEVDVIDNVAEVVGKCSRRIDNVLPTLNSVGLSSIVPALNTVKYELDMEKNECNSLKNALRNIVIQYVKQELMLVANRGTLGDLLKEVGQRIGDIIEGIIDELFDIDPYEIDSVLFDDDGWYGGKQGGPKSADPDEKKALYEIIQENIPDHSFTDDEFKAFLARANSEGCGYIALTNSVFLHFENYPEGFEETFGYPMYNEDGDLNYNMLFIDIYSSSDHINPDTGEIDIWGNYKEEADGESSSYDQWLDQSGLGTTSSDRDYYINQFMEEHGIEANYESHVNVTPYNFQEISEDGKTVIISYYDGYIYDSNNKPHHINAHAMVVTGVTEDGKYIVSSWGKEYYLDPNQTEFVDDDGNVENSSWFFDTVSYE